MDSISYTTARRNLAKAMDQACNDNAPVVITRKGKASVVMMSLEEYQAMEEAAYLLRLRANAINLLESISELKKVEVVGKSTFNSGYLEKYCVLLLSVEIIIA